MTTLSIPERAQAFAQDWAKKTPTGSLADLAEAAMRSERELCAKELEEMGKNGIGLTEALILKEAAKLLREGGQR